MNIRNIFLMLSVLVGLCGSSAWAICSESKAKPKTLEECVKELNKNIEAENKVHWERDKFSKDTAKEIEELFVRFGLHDFNGFDASEKFMKKIARALDPLAGRTNLGIKVLVDKLYRFPNTFCPGELSDKIEEVLADEWAKDILKKEERSDLVFCSNILKKNYEASRKDIRFRHEISEKEEKVLSSLERVFEYVASDPNVDLPEFEKLHEDGLLIERYDYNKMKKEYFEKCLKRNKKEDCKRVFEEINSNVGAKPMEKDLP